MKNNDRLLPFGIKLLKTNSGCCSGKYTTITYILPIKLDINILPFLSEYDDDMPSFEKTGLLKIDNKFFTIIGIRMISQIRLTIKIPNGEEIIYKFEEKIINYVQSQLK